MAEPIAFFRKTARQKLFFASIAVLVPALGIWAFLADTKYNDVGRSPVMVYMKSWPASRSEAEVRADQHQAEIARAENNARVRAGAVEARKRLKAAHIDAPWWD